MDVDDDHGGVAGDFHGGSAGEGGRTKRMESER